MKSKYSFEKEDSYLNLTISGEYDKMDFLSYPQLIKEECEKEGTHRILVNGLGVTGASSETIERFLFGEKLADVLGGKIKLACAWPKKDINKFAETVANNRGGYVCVFGDIETAKKWLLSST